jgi:hypothetical protein
VAPAVLVAPEVLVALVVLVLPVVLVVLVALAVPEVLVVLVGQVVLADQVDPVVLAVLLVDLEDPAADPMPCVSRCWTPRGGRRSWTTW